MTEPLLRLWGWSDELRPSRLTDLLAILVAPLSVVVASLVSPHTRVGDGSEYYAMYLSWITTGHPYLSLDVERAYGGMFASERIIGLVPFEYFAKAFPYLAVDNTQDLNHFWFYSGLAALIGQFGSLADPTNAFVALHVLLALAATTVALYLFRWPGVIAVTLILVASPALWFANKVHTEYFTITLSAIAVVSLLGRRFTWAALALAMAATQNPSFALGTVIVGLLWLTDPAQKPTKIDAAIVGLASVAVVLHPLYYLSRFGGLTPQLFGYGATTNSSSFRHFYLWLFDLDIGLLPNWPLGIAILLLGLYALPELKFDGGWRAFIALAALFVVDLVANSMTTNLNAGGTVDVSRYGTWYLCFFVPFVIAWLRAEGNSATAGVVSRVAVVAILGAISIFAYRPWRPESYLRPTAISLWVQTHAPWLYTPPGEIFADRYGDVEIHRNFAAVVGPDCRKIAFNYVLDKDEIRSPYCTNQLFDRQKLVRLIREQATRAPDGYWSVIRLSDEEAKAALLRWQPGSRVGPQNLEAILNKGWSAPEQWGVWTDGHRARLSLPILAGEFPSGVRIEFQMVGFAPREPQKVTLIAAYTQPKTLLLGSQPQTITIEVLPRALSAVSPLAIDFQIPDAVSPNSLGMSPDRRQLGLGLLNLRVNSL